MESDMAGQKRVVAIHDISCIGRCSLTVALPIISATGIECSVIPTAVLSTHTGGFTGYTYRDMTEDIVPIVDHWKTLGIGFDAIYTGFLGSKQQIEIVKDTIARLSDDRTLAIVDPAMADNGKMYPIFDMAFAREMASLCAVADIVVPNITEACFMLGREYVEGPYTPEFITGLMKDLCAMGCKKVVLTGVYYETGKLGAATYDSETGESSYYCRDVIPGYYHGTGDVFASALVAALINGRTLPDSSRIAVDYTVGSIIRTYEAGTDVKYGVNFEAGLYDLTKEIRGC